MKSRKTVCAMLMALTVALSATPAFAAEVSQTTQPTGAKATACYPTAVTRSEDGTEIRKMYDLGPEDDPAGIPRSDFDQAGFHFTLVDLLKQELPANESRQQTETVSIPSKSKDMGAVLALLPQEREFLTEDGLSGILTLQLDSVKVEVAGYGSSTKELTATRTYPGLSNQDTSNIPKTVESAGAELTLQSIDWQSDAEGHFTGMATYTGTTTSSYVKGYTVTADYTGTVSRINLKRIRYVAIFEGEPLDPVPTAEPTPDPSQGAGDTSPAESLPFPWKAVLIPVGIVAVVGVGIGAGIFFKKKHEESEGNAE